MQKLSVKFGSLCPKVCSIPLNIVKCLDLKVLFPRHLYLFITNWFLKPENTHFLLCLKYLSLHCFLTASKQLNFLSFRPFSGCQAVKISSVNLNILCLLSVGQSVTLCLVSSAKELWGQWAQSCCQTALRTGLRVISHVFTLSWESN